VAHLRHTRDANARRSIRPALVALPVALAATASAVTLGVVLQGSAAPDSARERASLSVAARELDPARTEPSVEPGADTGADTGTTGATEAPSISRSDARALGPVKTVEKAPNLMDRKVTRAAIRTAKAAGTTLWTTDALNLWTRPGDNAEQDGELEAGKQVLVTGRTLWGREEVVVQGKPRWVTEGYLSEDEPVGAGAGLSMAPCPDGSVENGLTDRAVYVYRSVCHAFPEISTYGGWDNHGEHASGRALDIMTSDVTLGTAIADFLREHAAELDLYDVIWRQHIFTQERAGEGWRSMSDRGSTTANHYDHVHVSTY